MYLYIYICIYIQRERDIYIIDMTTTAVITVLVLSIFIVRLPGRRRDAAQLPRPVSPRRLRPHLEGQFGYVLFCSNVTIHVYVICRFRFQRWRKSSQCFSKAIPVLIKGFCCQQSW